MRNMLFVAIVAALLSGCWTFGTSEYPQTEIASAPSATNVTVAVSGFRALQTWSQDVVSYDTVYYPGYYGRHYYRPGGVAVVPTRHYVVGASPTDAYLLRAKDAFEKAGYSVGASVPDWTVDVEFGGPLKTTGDQVAGAAWILCTAFFCDYEAVSWTAKLRVRDNRTGKLVFHQDYMQRYETKVFGLIPLFGIASCTETTYDYTQTWCLSALTDRAVADATAFLATSGSAQPPQQ